MAIIIKPLTNIDIKNAKIGRLRDGEGLILDITPYSKNWRLIYYHPITKRRTSLTFGSYPTLSLKQARERRAEYKQLLREGIDPKEHLLKIQRNIEQNIEKQFYNVALKWKAFKAKKVTEKTMDEDWRRLENHIFPTLANLSVDKINAKILVDTLQKVYKKGQTSVIEKVLRSVEGIMDYAENTGLIEIHNCHKAKKAFHYKPAENNPTISDEELPAFIYRMQTAKLKPQTRYLLFWNLLTGVRPSEAVSVEWSEIDWENRLWHIPKEKMKGSRFKKREHTVPLSPQAITILHKMRDFPRRSNYVFPHYLGGGRPMCSETVNRVMKANGYKGIFTSHGMRALISTHLNSQGFDPDAIEAVLAHTVKGNRVRKVYNRHNYLQERIPIMDYWGNFIEECGLKWA
ncbi:MAG: tyrosine-type recombinase/integrase [Pasteurellaceae bacterium]|nr:tyrosine-type recombinase/integrase [Pasteurellaceae bacterium]